MFLQKPLIQEFSELVNNLDFDTNVTIPKKTYDNMNFSINKLIETNNLLNVKVKRLQKSNMSLRKLCENSKNLKCLKKVFNTDQISILFRKNAKQTKWSISSVSKAMKIRAAGGRNALNQIRDMGYPLPSVSTINRRLKNLAFDSGLLSDFILYLKQKVPSMKNLDRHCALSSDAMHIIPGYEVDPSTKKIIGGISFPESTGDATCALVFMVCGVRFRWKETVAYYFTGKSVSGKMMKQIVHGKKKF